MKHILADNQGNEEPPNLLRAVKRDGDAADKELEIGDDEFPRKEFVELIGTAAFLLSLWLLIALTFAKKPEQFFAFISDLSC